MVLGDVEGHDIDDCLLQFAVLRGLSAADTLGVALLLSGCDSLRQQIADWSARTLLERSQPVLLKYIARREASPR